MDCAGIVVSLFLVLGLPHRRTYFNSDKDVGEVVLYSEKYSLTIYMPGSSLSIFDSQMRKFFTHSFVMWSFSYGVNVYEDVHRIYVYE